MSVFTTRTKSQHLRNVVALAGLCAVVAGGVFASRALYAPLTAAVRDAMIPAATDAIPVPTETVFPEPRVIDWDAVVLGTLSGGGGLALKRSDTGEMFQAYGTNEQIASASSGPVRIQGRWTGISCAYQRTLFDGQCTPTVDIDVLEILPITLE